MPPHAGAGDAVDWREAERLWGTPFPDDYRQFVGKFGEGAIENYLATLVPMNSWYGGEDGMSEETENARGTWAGESVDSLPAGVDGTSLIAWGVDASGDILCWAAGGKDPDRWPVVVFARQGWPTWRVSECGMVEFLLKSIRGEFEDCPLSGTDIWAINSPRFLHRREEQRIRNVTGRSPWLDDHT